MSGPRLSIAAAFTLILGVSDIVILNLHIAPKVFGRDHGPAIAGQLDFEFEPDDAAPSGQTPEAMDAAVPSAEVRLDAAVLDAAAASAGDELFDAAPTQDVLELPDAGSDAPDTGFQPEMYNLYFGQDRATLKAQHRKHLDEVVSTLLRHPEAIVVVEGYADASETRYGLNALIKRRIHKAETYFTKRNIAPERIRSVSRGVWSDEARLNRRVRLRVEVP